MPAPPAPAAGSSWVARLTDHRVVLAVAIAMLVASVASLTVRIVVGTTIDMTGTIIDGRTKQPVTGAHIVAVGIHERSTKTGAFSVTDVDRGTKLRFSADDYRHRDVEATSERTSISLDPIPVTGKVTSSFTSKGIGATVRGAEATKTRSDGTFTTYGVGPGDTVTVTAFGHASKKVKVPASRDVSVALELGRIAPDALIKPVAGYGFADVPSDELAAERAAFAATFPELGRIITGSTVRSITKDGRGIGFVTVTAFEPSYAALPGLQNAYLDGFAVGATKSRDVRMGSTRVRFAQGDGMTGYAWQRFAAFVVVITEGSNDAKTIAESLIGARTAVPTESV